MTAARTVKLRRLGPLRRRFQPVRLLLEHGLRGWLGATAEGAPVALATRSRASAVG